MLKLCFVFPTEDKVCSPDRAEDLWKFCNKDMLKQVGHPASSAFFSLCSLSFLSLTLFPFVCWSCFYSRC